MKRTNVTYGQLDKALRALGFSYRFVDDTPPPARVYEHKDSGALIALPAFPDSDLVLGAHMVSSRLIVDMFGIADPDKFDAEVRRATRNGRRPAGGKP